MDLLERYLHAVKQRLPWDRQDDIAAELRTNLQAQVEDRETELGRPLTDAEVEAWLRQLGSPRRMADRYRPARYLIGPELYSNYVLVLRIVLGWTLALTLFFGAFNLAAAYPHLLRPWLATMQQLTTNLIANAGLVTLIFAAVEFWRTRSRAGRAAASHPDTDWSPRDLPPLETAIGDHGRPRTLRRVLGSLAVGCLGLAWLLILPYHPFLIIGPGAYYLPSLPYTATPALQLIYWLLVAQLALAVAWRLVTLATGHWRTQTSAEILVFRLLGFVPGLVALTAPGHRFIALAPTATDPAKYAPLVPTLNEAFYKLAILLFAIGLLQFLWHLGRMAVATYRRRAVTPTSAGAPHSSH